MLKNSPIHDGARKLLNDVFSKLPNPDNHFVKEFQSQGFNSRVFELGLFPLLIETGLQISRDYDAPDYILTNGEQRIAIEASASNPTEVGKNTLADIKKLSPAAEKKRKMHDFAIRAGSTLFTKLRKEYWKLDHCKGIPLVFAYQALHEGGSLFIEPERLIEYLIGVRLKNNIITGVAKKNEKGHRNKSKQIPSGFFKQPGAENVSAVLFTNSLTVPKFFRMADIKKKHPLVSWRRTGIAYLPNPDFLVGSGFMYYRKDKIAKAEDWSQSALLIHNPNALHPINKELFPLFSHAIQHNGNLTIEVPRFHPIASKTEIFPNSKKAFEELKKKAKT